MNLPVCCCAGALAQVVLLASEQCQLRCRPPRLTCCPPAPAPHLLCPQKTPRASKLAAEAEAVTVSPKRRSTRTPAKAEAAEAGEPTPRRRGRPAKAE